MSSLSSRSHYPHLRKTLSHNMQYSHVLGTTCQPRPLLSSLRPLLHRTPLHHSHLLLHYRCQRANHAPMERMGERPLRFLPSRPIPCNRVENERGWSNLCRNVSLALDLLRLFNFWFLRV